MVAAAVKIKPEKVALFAPGAALQRSSLHAHVPVLASLSQLAAVEAEPQPL
jgi:hypothetical protein